MPGLSAVLLLGAVTETVFRDARAATLASAGLPGLGLFFYVFLVLLVSLEAFRFTLKSSLERSEAAQQDLTAQNDNQTGDRSVLTEVIEDEASLSTRVTGAQSEGFDDFSSDPIRILIRRSRRLAGLTNEFTLAAKEWAGQLGLLGTIVGLAGGLGQLLLSAKDAGGSGGGMLAALGGSGLHVAFSSTIAGVLIIVVYILPCALLGLRVRNNTRGLVELQRRLEFDDSTVVEFSL